MRNFLSFIRDSEKTRLDIFCYDEKEVRELSQILKKGFKFYVIYAIEGSLLAFRVGEYPEVKDIMNDLEKFYGFEWDGVPLIYDTVKKKSSKKF